MNGNRTHLLIPIHVDALVVGENDSDSDSSPLKNGTVSAAPDYAKLKDFYLAGPHLRRPQENLDPVLGPGVHLHFRLPAAIAHGNLDKTPAFPKLPNRWLAQRYHMQAGKLATKTWLIRSDQEATDAKDVQSAAVLLISPPPPGIMGDLYCRPTGVASVIWPGNETDDSYNFIDDNERAEVELTAVTGGDPGFSAHYPACRSILGLYDDLADVPADPKLKLSYLVTGWYSSIEDDPWSNFLTTLPAVHGGDEKLKRVDQWLEERGCAGSFEGEELPAGILCHGSVNDVRRQENGCAPTVRPDPYGKFEDLKEYWVDLGNTSAEALAARVAKKLATEDRVDLNLLEDLVTALQIGLFSQGSDPARMDAELHRQGFMTVAGGKRWVIQQVTPAFVESDFASPLSIPTEVQVQLDVLNALEKEYERHVRLFEDYRRELYALWHRWTDSAKRDELSTQGELTSGLEKLEKFVQVYEGELDRARTKRDNAKKQLCLRLGDLSKEPSTVLYSLAEEPLEPFYAPKDPVLLLTGPAAQAKGTRSRPAVVTVRRTGHELRSFSYDLDQRPGQTFEATDVWLKAKGISAEYLQTIPPWSLRLFREALLLDEMQTRPLAGASSRYPGAVEKLSKRPDRPDPFSRFTWRHNPWIPLYLFWEVSWQPDEVGGEIAADGLTKHWTLKNEGGESKRSLYRRNTELIPLGGSPPAQSQSVECHGLSFIGLPLFNLQYERAEAGTKLQVLMEQIDQSLGSRRSVMISQPLSGLHDALMLRRAGDQLPPLDYDRWHKEDIHPLYFDSIRQILGGDFHPDSSPVMPVEDSGDTPPFCPVRAGLLQLRDLRIIDAFGQVISVWPENLPSDAAHSPDFGQSGRLEASPSASEYPPTVRLHPRFCRPMRLEFAGIPADASSTLADPICGWVVLNRFDQNLVLYAASGKPVGILQKRFAAEGKTQFYWVAVPGVPDADANVNSIQNVHLRDFANFVLSLDFAAGGRFAELINKAVEATEERVPEDNPLISVLVGRPLALVRAELHLETDGLPAFDQTLSWTAKEEADSPSLDELLETSLRTVSSPPPNRFMKTGGVEEVRLPVRLGDQRSTNDGLVGFFRGEPPVRRDASSMVSSPFYPSWGFDFGNVAYPGLRSTQDLELDYQMKLRVTLLMDPQARVHVTSGILPKSALELSRAQLRGAKELREVFFQAAPVLGTPTTPYVPKPSDDYGQWSWTYRPSVTGWAEDPDMVSAAELAGPSVGWPTLTEGWLKLKIEPDLIRSLWMKAPAQNPQKGTNVTLAWSLQGADSVALFRLRPDGTTEQDPEKQWSAAPLAEECTTLVNETTVFRIRASNQAGYEEFRDIEIEIEE
jgi:hypothetical protein